MKNIKGRVTIAILVGVAALCAVVYGIYFVTSGRQTEVSQTMPEEIQGTGSTVSLPEEAPLYEYEQQEIEVMNQSQRIYGIAYIKKYRILTGICIGIFLLGAAGSLWLLRMPHGAQVDIVQDGNVLYTFDLASAEDQTFEIEYEGRINTVQLENGRIRMLDAECPDRTCVHMGWLDSGAMPIVCLPNHLSIEYAETGDHVDAVIR